MYLFSNLGVSGQTSPLSHKRSRTGGPLCALGDIHIHCSRIMEPLQPGTAPLGWWLLPRLSNRGFQPEGFGLWAGQVMREGKPSKADGAKNQASGSSPAPPAPPVPADPAAHPVSGSLSSGAG